MPHGIDEYFAEVASFHRRLCGIGLLVLAGMTAGEFVARHPAIVAALNDPHRFGFEGPEQYVERIRLEEFAQHEQLGSQVETVIPISLRRGGGLDRPVRRGTRPVPEAPRRGRGPGADESDLESRLRALALSGPVIRSEDLIVERLVRPQYPEEARNQDVEGVVELFALVDTTGTVTEVHIVGGSHQPLLEQAATTAVLQCRYRPYRVRQTLEQVWAYYRISFSLY